MKKSRIAILAVGICLGLAACGGGQSEMVTAGQNAEMSQNAAEKGNAEANVTAAGADDGILSTAALL